MFGIAKRAKDLRWHGFHKSEDGKMRHLVDSLAWSAINRKLPYFASDPRNIRFGIATDGFNPYQDLSSRYICWPAILAVYNFLPLFCMSKESSMLILLIPGPKQPGNDIDIFLVPLIEDLKDLWTIGIYAYDAYNDSTFNLKAILMWTINDFSAYGNMSGWPRKGRYACPVCRENTCSKWLPHSRKFLYMGHTLFLAMDHPFLIKLVWFNGKHEKVANRSYVLVKRFTRK
ncbi:hypothetical protein Dsin_006041 [Dipteronia sinensis]|uniref:Transposase n=1 Tax=Dipteronia sinensis TaxID=43782 RepID=A0AAE0EFH2_9ROSI|nr:hypothetical protein Dsin_006041 [Dipteronia sinensis]